MTLVSDIAKYIEAWAPKASAQSYDNVGLQVGDNQQSVSKCLVALDLTHKVIDEAIESSCELIITHHPIIFKPIKNVRADNFQGGMIHKAIQNGISVYTGHTNVDAAKGGVSFLLAQALGLKDVDFLSPLESSIVKLVSFVPKGHLESVRKAMGEAGAGVIGEYEKCSFSSEGTGTFFAGENSSPQIGEKGALNSVEEYRLEVQCHSWEAGKVVSALMESHPYEEVAFDLYPLENTSRGFGLGCIGKLPESLSLGQFLEICKSKLSLSSLRYSADSMERKIASVAVCGGSGTSLIPIAKQKGAQAFVTADLTYHTFFDSFGGDGKPEMTLVDVGHYESEVMIEQYFVDRLKAKFSEIEFKRTKHPTNPVRYH